MVAEVRQATQKNRAAIGAFLEKAFPNQYRYPDRWEWLNLRNPFIPDGFGLPEWIVLVDGHINGHHGAMLVQVKMDERTVIAGWNVDAFVTSATRGLCIAKKMQAANQSAHPLSMSLEMTHLYRAILKKLGHQEGPAVSLLYRLEHILPSPFSKEIDSALHRYCGLRKHFWERVAKQTGLLQACCWIISKLIKARQRHAAISTGVPPFTIEHVSRFDEQADELWATIRSRYNFAVERTSTYLNWKYCDQPHMHYQCFYIREHESIQGILVIRRGESPEPPIGVICECYLRKPTQVKYSWVIQKAVSKLTEQGAGGVWAATAEPELEKVLHKQGFLRLRQDPTMLHIADGLYHAKKELQPALIGKGDHDWDQFPGLRQPYLREFIMLAAGRL
jgi:hypothetical protein